MIGIDLTEGAGLSIGRKAATLARLAAVGFPVPPGVVLAAGAADSEIEGFCEEVLDRFGDVPMAVRSSSSVEDGVGASMAGRFVTMLDVTMADLARAVRRVRKDLGTARSIAVLVMPMLRPRASGVAFTVDPVTGRRECRISAVSGTSAELTAGRADGEEWVVGEHPRRLTDLGVLAPDEAQAIAVLARSVEDVEGRPQDIEWAMVDVDPLLLQARPVTALS